MLLILAVIEVVTASVCVLPSLTMHKRVVWKEFILNGEHKDFVVSNFARNNMRAGYYVQNYSTMWLKYERGFPSY